MARKPHFDVLIQLGALRRYARALTRNEADAEDLVHDTLVRAYEKRASFKVGGSLRAWMLSILHNVFIDARRRQKAEAERIGWATELDDGAVAPAQDLRIRLQQVRRAFMELPEDQRAALHLVAIEGMTFAEAAEALEIPVGTLMSRLARARATLRALEDGDAEQATRGPARRRLRLVGGTDGPSS